MANCSGHTANHHPAAIIGHNYVGRAEIIGHNYVGRAEIIGHNYVGRAAIIGSKETSGVTPRMVSSAFGLMSVEPTSAAIQIIVEPAHRAMSPLWRSATYPRATLTRIAAATSTQPGQCPTPGR